MKQVGNIRKMDSQNRVVIPSDICKRFNLCKGTPMEIFAMDDGSVVLRAYDERNEGMEDTYPWH